MGGRQDRSRVPGRGLRSEHRDGDNGGRRARSRAVPDHSPSAPLITEPHHLGSGHRVCVIRSLLGDAA
jgi:hypothetical protein